MRPSIPGISVMNSQGEFKKKHPLKGVFRRGNFNVIFSFLTKQNSDPTLQTIIFLGQRTRPIVHDELRGSRCSRMGVIFPCRCQEGGGG